MSECVRDEWYERLTKKKGSNEGGRGLLHLHESTTEKHKRRRIEKTQGLKVKLTLSLSTFDGAKVATVVSGTWMGSPVRGLRAVRADRTEVPKEPKPTSETVGNLICGRKGE